MFDWSSMILFSGVVNAFFCIILLILNRRIYKTNYLIWLVLILSCQILILLERIIRFSNLEPYLAEFLFITSPLFFLILPLIYTLQKQLGGLPKLWYLHFIIPLLSIVVFFPSITLANEEKLRMYNNENIKDSIWIVLFYTFYAIYYLVSIFLTNKKFKIQILNHSADNKVESELLINRIVFIASTLIAVIPLSFLMQYTDAGELYDSKLLFGIFSFMPYLFLYAIFSRNEKQIYIKPKNTKVNSSPEDQLVNHKKELLKYMTEQQPYLNQSLSLPELAKAMGWSRSFLSTLINSKFGKNFYDFVNGFRLEYALKRINEGEYKEHTLEYIVMDSGFKSYVSFYRIFKKSLNETPSKYINRLESG